MADPADSNLDEIESTHPDYDEFLVEWETIDDVCRGSRRVKECGERYLPKLSGEEKADYENRKTRAKFFGATNRTKESLTGMILRKTPTVERGGLSESDLSDVTLTGLDVIDYSRQVIEALVSKGRAGTLIDFSDSLKTPYLSFYKAEDVLNWAGSRIDGREVLTMLILREYEDFVEDFDVTRRKRIRRYMIRTENLENAEEDDDKLLPGVIFDTWIEKTGDDGEVSHFDLETEPANLTRRSQPLTEIPFVFHNSGHLGSAVGGAPIYDIAALNVIHYGLSASMANGLHFTGLPTPYATGIDDDTKELRIGSESAWLIEEPNAKVGFLEFTGKGLEELRKGIEETERQMAMLGARLLTEEKKEAEAFETHQLRAGAETSALAHTAGTASVTMSEVMRWFDWWNSTLALPKDSSALFIFSTEFSANPMAPNMFAELVKAVVANAISYEVFFYNLKQGEFYPDDWTIEKEKGAVGNGPIPAPVAEPPKKEETEEE